MLQKVFEFLYSCFAPFDESEIQEKPRDHFSTYRGEVLSDIQFLERFVEAAPYRFEREKDPYYLKLREGYSKNFCLSRLEPYFTFDQRAEYFMLRRRIDELFEQNGPTEF